MFILFQNDRTAETLAEINGHSDTKRLLYKVNYPQLKIHPQLNPKHPQLNKSNCPL